LFRKKDKYQHDRQYKQQTATAACEERVTVSCIDIVSLFVKDVTEKGQRELKK